METQESGTGRVRFITRAFPRAFPPQWKAGLIRMYMMSSINLNSSYMCGIFYPPQENGGGGGGRWLGVGGDFS